MKNQVQLVRQFPTDNKNLFAYFLEEELRSKWLSSTTLKFEGKVLEVRPYRSLVLKIGSMESSFVFEMTSVGTIIKLSELGHATKEAAIISEIAWHQRLSFLMRLIDQEAEFNSDSAFA
jgi:hypothetical protein